MKKRKPSIPKKEDKKKSQKNKQPKPTRVVSLCTDDGREFDRIRHTAIKRAFKSLAVGRFTKEAVAQFIADSEFTVDFKMAVLNTFYVEYKTLNKKEKKAIRTAFSIAESNYLSRLHKLVITDDKAHASLKVIAEIKGMIKKEAPVPVSPNAGLKITLMDEKGNQIPEKYKDHAKKKKKEVPLTLNDDQTAVVH